MRMSVQHARSIEVYCCETVECMCEFRIRWRTRIESTRVQSRGSLRQGRRECDRKDHNQLERVPLGHLVSRG